MRIDRVNHSESQWRQTVSVAAPLFRFHGYNGVTGTKPSVFGSFAKETEAFADHWIW